MSVNEASPPPIPLRQTYINAVAALPDITTFRTNPGPSVVSIGQHLQQEFGEDIIPQLPLLELYGVSIAIATRFEGTPHYQNARFAVGAAAVLTVEGRQWFDNRSRIVPSAGDAGESSPDQSASSFHAFLRSRLDWVRQEGTLDNGAFVITAYLQLIVCCTHVEDWAAAAANSEESPMAFAWEWARTSPLVGREIADVVVLVSMGCHIYRVMAAASANAEKERRQAARITTIAEEVWTAVKSAGSQLLGVITSSQISPSPSSFNNDYQPIPELYNEEQLQKVQTAATLLRKAGERYAELLGEKDATRECVDECVVSIRSMTELVLGKAEPPLPETVLQVIPGLAFDK